MANLSYLDIGIPSANRLVFRNIHDQVVTPVTPTAPTGFGGGGGARHYTPLPDSVRRRIDQVIERECKIKEQLAEYEDKGADISVLTALLEKLKELQLLLLRLALEYEAAAAYIEKKRCDQEDEDMAFIASIL